MVVEQVCGAMKADGCLARTGSALHREQFVEGGPDDLVLFRLDGGDDVEHLARAGTLELGEEGVAAPEACGAWRHPLRAPKRSSATATTAPRSTMI